MRILFAAALSMTMTCVSAAPPSVEVAEKLLVVLGVHLYNLHQEFDVSAKFQAEQDETIASLVGPCVDEKSKLELENIKAHYTKRFAEELSWDATRSKYIKYFQQALTEEEANAILTFLETPGGLALLYKVPPLRDIGAPRFAEEYASQIRSDRNRELNPIIKSGISSPIKCQ